uniref:hypothetical protein n=1 Tax=Pseudomonas aeruginosa TaxID=287 RepID=UPI002359ADA0
MIIADSSLSDFFLKNPDFDIRKFDFIANKSEAPFKSLSVDSETLAKLESYQRLFELSDSQHVVHTLRENGFHSAHRIAALPASQFVSRMEGLLGEKQALHA